MYNNKIPEISEIIDSLKIQQKKEYIFRDGYSHDNIQLLKLLFDYSIRLNYLINIHIDDDICLIRACYNNNNIIQAKMFIAYSELINDKFDIVQIINHILHYDNINHTPIIKYLMWLYKHNYNKNKRLIYCNLLLQCVISKCIVLRQDIYNIRYIINNNRVLSYYLHSSILDYIICIVRK